MTTTPVPSSLAPLKERLLDAALDALRELDPEALLHTIGAREIARRAGGSPASINHHYGSLAGLADAVVTRVFDTTHLDVPRINELIAQIKNSTLPLAAAFAMHEAEFTRLTTDPEFKLRMGLWSLGGEQVTARYGAYLRDLDAQLVEAGEALFDSWGRELRPPVDLAAYMALKVALVNGMTVRQLADPDDRRLHLFQRATVALDLVLLRVVGDRHDLDARLAEMNYYPLDRRRQRTDHRNRSTVARILRAANELFRTQGFDDTGIEQIATHSDTSLTTLKRYYPTKRDLAVALFQHQASEHYPPIPTSGALGTAPHSPTLRAHLGDLTTFARARAPYATAYLAHLAATIADAHDPLVAATQQRISAGTVPSTNHDLAVTLVVTTLRHALTRPTDAPMIVADRTLELIRTT